MIPILLAQIVALATDGTGQQLRYLVNYEPRGIYRHGAVEPLPSPRPEGQELTAPFLSSDGRTTGWSAYSPCRGGSCGFFALPRASFTFQRGDRVDTYFGLDVWPSRNGRYLLQTSVPMPEFPGTLVDLDTNTRTPVRVHTWSARKHVSDEGDVIGFILDSPLEYGIQDRAGNIRRFSVPEPLSSVAISADGRTHAVVTRSEGTLTLRPSSFQSREEILYELSADGTRMLIASGPELLLYDGALKTLAHCEDAIRAIALSDNGRIAYAATNTGSVERFDLDNHTSEVLLPPFVSEFRIASSATRGSAVRFTARGLTPDTQVRLGDQLLTRIDTDEPNIAYFQLPWTLDHKQFHPLTIERPGYPFTLQGQVFVWDRIAPYIMPAAGSNDYVKAAQQNFTSMVSPDNPAPAGSTVHTWLTGLGPLDRDVPEGQPGPSDPPAHPLAPLACYLRNETTPPVGLELPFVAYAPGLVGVYQVDMRVPANWPAGEHFINCESSDGPGANLVRITTR